MENNESVKKVRRKHINYISILTVLSTLAVVTLHVNHFWDFDTKLWPLYNAVESVCYFAVPIFVMISGALLLDYREKYSTKVYFKKRILRVVIPYVICSVIYILIELKHGNSFTIKDIISIIVNGKGFGIYGFFILLFNIYLCIPFISLIPKDSRKNGFLYIIIIGLIVNCIIPMLFKYLNIEFSNDWYISMLGGYLLFVFLGYYIHNYDIKLIFRIIIYILGLASLLFMLIGTYRRSLNEGSISLFYKSYTNIYSTLYASAIFLFFKNISKFKFMDKIGSFCSVISPYCFGVYLLHKIFQNWFCREISFFDNSIGTDILLILILFTISLAIFYLYSKILDFIIKVIDKKNSNLN